MSLLTIVGTAWPKYFFKPEVYYKYEDTNNYKKRINHRNSNASRPIRKMVKVQEFTIRKV